MQLIVKADGVIECVYDELIDLARFGHLQIRRASYVEPDPEGNWYADLGPSGGPHLGPFASRSLALQAERAWLEGPARPQKADLRSSFKGSNSIPRSAHPLPML